MQAQRIDDAQTWDNALLALPNAHALHGWDCGAFKWQHCWSATRLLF